MRAKWTKRRALVALTIGLFVSALLWPYQALRSRAPLSRAVYAADGSLLRLTLAEDGQYRLWTPLSEISPSLIQATLLYEDRHFYHHLGVNPVSMLRALSSVVLGKRRIGGSTLTMQLARRLWHIDSRGMGGKVLQMVAAAHLELAYSKDEILEAYLNLVPYGGNIEGIGAAAQVYFGKLPRDLQVTDAITLAVIPQSPGKRGTPAASKRVTSAALMKARARLWALWRTDHEVHDSDLTVMSKPPQMRSLRELPFRAPHLSEEALRASDAATSVHTTLQPAFQRIVEREVTRFVAAQKRLGIRNAAVLITDDRTSEIVALMGSADYFSNAISGAVDGTAARRSPGSTLKPFVYGLAMDQGLIHPQSLVRDAPTRFSDYTPENFDGEFAGPVSATDALVRSRNIPAVALAAKLTSPTLFGLLRQAGIGGLLEEAHYGLGIALGAAELTMRELAALYGALARGGHYQPVHLLKGHQSATDVSMLSRESSFLVLQMLAQSPRPDALAPALSTVRGPPTPWKTGTSWGFRDAWAIGFVGHYVISVWVGDFASRSNPAFVGRKAAGPLFFAILDALVASRLVQPIALTAPAGVRQVPLCALTGALPGPDCPHTRKGWFIPGRSPIDRCEVHRVVTIDDETGERLCEVTEGRPTHRALYEVWPSDLAALFVAAGLAREPLPPPGPGCRMSEQLKGKPPRLISPTLSSAFVLSGPASSWKPVPLRAETDGEATEVFYFVDGSFAGRAKSGVPVFWDPRPGKYLLRVLDDRGRATSTEMRVQVVQ